MGRKKDRKKERREERKTGGRKTGRKKGRRKELNDRVRIMTFVKDSGFVCFLFPLEDVQM